MGLVNSRRAFSFVAAAFLLAACGGAREARDDALPLVAPPAQNGAQAVTRATSGDLLYATMDARPYVYVMTYPKIKLIQTLKDFPPPGAGSLCADAAGGVYVTWPGVNLHGNGHVYVYEHGATKPSRVLQGPYGIGACSVDPATGDLAVMASNWSEYGRVAIYHKARGTPTIYQWSAGLVFSDCAYGDRSKLYIAVNQVLDSTPYVGVFANRKFSLLSLPQRLRIPIHLQWHSGALVVTAQPEGYWPYEQQLYWIRAEGSSARVIRTITLRRKHVPYPRVGLPDWIEGDRLFAPGHSLSSLVFWKYPQGGESIGAVRVKVGPWFNGLVVSPGR